MKNKMISIFGLLMVSALSVATVNAQADAPGSATGMDNGSTTNTTPSTTTHQHASNHKKHKAAATTKKAKKSKKHHTSTGM